MNHYVVEWAIDIWADTPREAAEQAHQIMLDPDSAAVCFEVVDDANYRVVFIDLDKE